MRRVTPFVLVLTAVLAGCSAVGESGPAPAEPDPPAAVPERDESSSRGEREELGGGQAAPAEEGGAGEGESASATPAPDRPEAPVVEGPTLDGAEISLADFRGKPVFLKVWASW